MTDYTLVYFDVFPDMRFDWPSKRSWPLMRLYLSQKDNHMMCMLRLVRHMVCMILNLIQLRCYYCIASHIHRPCPKGGPLGPRFCWKKHQQLLSRFQWLKHPCVSSNFMTRCFYSKLNIDHTPPGAWEKASQTASGKHESTRRQRRTERRQT